MSQGAWERTELGKILALLGTGERIGAGFASAFLPEEARARLPKDGGVYGGDLVRAAFNKDPQNDSLAEKVAYGVGGALVGGALDPLTYLGVGAPLDVAKAGAKAAHPLLSIANPITGKALVRLSPVAVDEAAAGLGRTLRSGHALEQAATRLPARVPRARDLAIDMAKKIDRAGTLTANAFGIDIGVNPEMARLWKRMMSRQVGARGDVVRDNADMTKDFLEMAMEAKRAFGFSEQETIKKLQLVMDDVFSMDLDTLMKQAEDTIRMSPTQMGRLKGQQLFPKQTRTVTEQVGTDYSLTRSPFTRLPDVTPTQVFEPKDASYIQLKKQPRAKWAKKELTNQAGDDIFPANLVQPDPQLKESLGVLETPIMGDVEKMKATYTRNKERAAAAVYKNFGLPAQFGGPEGFFDSPLVRQVRGFRRQWRTAMRYEKDIANQDLKHWLHGQWADPNVSHIPRYMTDEARNVIDDSMREIYGAEKAGKAGGGQLSTNASHQLIARFRYIDQNVAQQILSHPLLRGPKAARSRKIIRHAVATNKGYPFIRGPMAQTMMNLYGKDKQLDSLLIRATRPLGPQEINQVIDQTGWWITKDGKRFDIIKPGQVKQAFVTNPLEIRAMRSYATKRQLIANEFLQEIKDKGLVMPKDQAPTGWREVPGVPELDGHAMDPDAARWMNSMAAVEQNLPYHIDKFLTNFYQPSLGWWKSWTLSIFPAYHARNFIGALWNWYVHGGDTEKAAESMKDVSSWWWSRSIRGDKSTRFISGINVSQLPKGANPDMNSLLKAARKEGILDDVGFVSRPGLRERSLREALRDYEYFGDPEDTVRNLIGKVGKKQTAEDKLRAAMFGADATWLTPKTSNKFVGAGFKIAAATDNNIRMATLIQRLKMGDSWDDAVRWVKKTQFDYHDLGPAERLVMQNLFPFYTWCVPDTSEALTKDGWKKHWELVPGKDMLLVYDPKTSQMRWEDLEDVHVFPYDGEVYTYKNEKTLNFTCTPGHRMIVEDNEGRRKVCLPHEVRSNYKIPLVGDMVDTGPSLLTPRDAAVIGWIVTDGYWRKRGPYFEAMIYQSPGKHLNKIRALVAGLATGKESIHPDTGVHCIRLKSSYVRRLAKVYQSKKDLPSIILQLDHKARAAMLEAMMDAEGHTEPSWEHFAQVPGPVLEAFQLLCFLEGRAANLSKRGCYIRKGKTAKLHNTVSVGWYEGAVWCPQTKTGTWVCRQDGKIIPTGNSRKNIPAQLEAIVRTPDRVARLHGAMQGFEGSDAPNEEAYLNNWLRENFPLRIKKNKDGQHLYFTMRNWLPLADISEMFHIQDAMLDQATPFAKLPIELAFNINSFTRYKIDRLIDNPAQGFQGKGERSEFFGMRVPNYYKHIFRSMRGVNTLHDIIDNPQNLDMNEALVKFFVGRLYPFQADRGLRELQYDLEGYKKETFRSYRSAQRAGASDKELRRILNAGSSRMREKLEERGIRT